MELLPDGTEQQSDLIDHQDLNLISLWVGSYPLNFLNVYINPETRNSMWYLDDVKDCIPSLYLIAGDFNAPSYHFDTLLPDVNNPNTRHIIDWVSASLLLGIVSFEEGQSWENFGIVMSRGA